MHIEFKFEMPVLNQSFGGLYESVDNIKVNIDQFFLIVCGIFVLFMQAGFAFLEAGSVRSKNTTNIIMKNVLDMFFGALSYYAIGYAFAYGEPGDGFIGHNHFFATNVFSGNTTQPGIMRPHSYYAHWFFQFTFAATVPTIVSGALAERTEFTAYIIYCVFLTGFVYPVVCHWVWAKSGWLKTGAGSGLSYMDFAGSGVVHVTGGTAALVGVAILGPRTGRYNQDGTANDLPGHSVTLTALGAFILFIGLLAFNGGSLQKISAAGDGVVVSMAVMNTVIGGSAGAITAMLLYKVTDALRDKNHYWSLLVSINGGLAGMVSMCATCNNMNPWSAVVIGTIAGSSYIAWVHLVEKLKLDDPVDAVAVHLGGGLCGVLLGPIFAINGLNVNGKYVGGIIYGAHPMAFKEFGWNLAGTLTIMAWTAATSALLFGILRLLGMFRVSVEVELHGLDKMKHGEPAYPKKGYETTSETTPLFPRRGKSGRDDGDNSDDSFE